MSKINALKRAANAIGIFCVPITFMDLIGHPSVVKGSSMKPTLNDKGNYYWWNCDIVWISKLYSDPRHGEIFAFTYPFNQKQIHIKRVNKIGGEIIQLKNGHLYQIPKNHLWMISDNSINANDSNIYGPVNYGLVKGKATRVIWPPNNWKKL